jgi:hypothetical protein
MYMVAIVARLALFASAFLLLEYGGKTAILSIFFYSSDLSNRELIALSSWGFTYVLMGIAALLIAIDLNSIGVRLTCITAIIGTTVSVWNIASVVCPSYWMNKGAFLLLSCIANPVQYASLCTSILLAASIWLRDDIRE